MRWLLIAALIATSLAGCTDDPSTEGDPTEPTPGGVPDTGGYNFTGLPEVITGMEFLSSAETTAVDGLWLHDDKAYLSGPGAGLRIFDISDPANPIVLANQTADVGNSRDVDIMVHPNGRTYAVLSSGAVDLVDVTDPTNPFLVSSPGSGSHNMAVVPNSTIVYNSLSINTDLGVAHGTPETGKIQIVDFADPEAPIVKEFFFPAVIQTPMGVPKVVASTTCHDITFHAGRQLGYCAGVSDTQIWDIADPWNPKIIQVIDWPGINIHHGVWATLDGNMLILGDEVAGVAAPVPGCGNEMPTSALWFIDVTNIETPTPLGYYQVSHDAVGASAEEGRPIYCSTHFGTLVEDRPMMVMGHYSAGTALIDFSDPANAREVALYTATGTNTWEARYYKGHVYTGDTGLGMEILELI